jgi:hypothetical protein
LKSKIKKCPHCGSTSTLPIAYGLITDKGHQKNAIKKEWVWGGCKFGAIGTDHCNECGKNFGEIISYEWRSKFTIKELIARADARIEMFERNQKK